MIVELAPAKINLALHVRRRRSDGYHDIETLFAFCRDGDVVTVERAETFSFKITGPFAAALGSGDNLVSHAVEAFRTTFRVHGRHAVTLDKRLPVASGIGGGSADAAAALRALAKMYRRSLDHPWLQQCAASLGADVPACLRGETVLGTGRGDTLVPVDGLAETPILLVNPGVAISTAAVFGAWDGIDRGPIPNGPLLDRARAGRNDLANPARCLAPAINAVLAMLEGAPGLLLARMSGSGATCFALFENVATRDAAAANAGAQGWWTLASHLS